MRSAQLALRSKRASSPVAAPHSFVHVQALKPQSHLSIATKQPAPSRSTEHLRLRHVTLLTTLALRVRSSCSRSSPTTATSASTPQLASSKTSSRLASSIQPR
ncbi:UNVERIFIED_CONTAM: hypothetical protein GTU68_042501 [Idotea baltica]|nr:hypothetical protein [Idotea baltica]